MADTMVLAAMNPMPIEQLQLGDQVYANTWVNSRHTIMDESGQEIYYAPFTSDDQRAVDKTATDIEQWYKISFEMPSLVGDVSHIHLLRPQ